jgi:hypothetical protein
MLLVENNSSAASKLPHTVPLFNLVGCILVWF